MSIRRSRLTFDNYAQIPNAWMRDARLSRKARGLLAELLTHRVGWEITIDSLVANGPEGRDAVRSAIKELERFGYLRRARIRRDDGTLSGADYELREPEKDAPTSENPTEGDPPPKKTIYKKNISTEDHDSKSTRTASGRAMSSKQLTMLMDLVLLLSLLESSIETEPEQYVRSLVSTYDEADELIREYWQQIEHAGREDISHDARHTPEVYERLSPNARRFVDQEDIVSYMDQGAA